MKSIFSTRAWVAAFAFAALSIGSPAIQDVGAQEKDAAKEVIAKAQPVATALPVKAKPIAKAVASSSPTLRPLSVSVDLLSETRLDGTLTDATTIEMQTSFGGASIPLSEVAGIRFASAENASTTVVMLNGDSITGATDVKLVTVETEWGTATINGSNISSMMFVPGLDWNPGKGLNGKRWDLINNKPPAKPKAASAPVSNGNGRVISPAPPVQNYPSNFQSGRVFRN